MEQSSTEWIQIENDLEVEDKGKIQKQMLNKTSKYL